jgi:ferredoxin
MTVRIDTKMKRELIRYGVKNIDECYSCGECTAACGNSDQVYSLPRGTVRLMQLGLRKELLRSPEPWLCYYCGDCSRTCPREANPAEHMMVSRRFLTCNYDWTGLSGKIYTSWVWEYGMIALGVLVVLLFFWRSGAFSPERMPTGHVSINTFIPTEWMHFADWTLALALLFTLGVNSLKMCGLIMGGGRGAGIPAWLYLKELKTLFWHLFTQTAWKKCEGPTRWFKHMLLFSGYAVMFLLVVVFLPWFQQDGPGFNFDKSGWTSLFGYYAFAVIVFGTVDAMISRLRKEDEIHKYSHRTDWTFLVLLLLTALTGGFMHLSRLLDWAPLAYYAYVAHLAVAVPIYFAALGKWSHLVYRPLAIYLVTVRQKADELRGARASTGEAAAPAG